MRRDPSSDAAGVPNAVTGTFKLCSPSVCRPIKLSHSFHESWSLKEFSPLHLKGLTLWNNPIQSVLPILMFLHESLASSAKGGPEGLILCQDVAANRVVIYVCSEFNRTRQLLPFGTSNRIIKLTLKPCQNSRSRPRNVFRINVPSTTGQSMYYVPRLVPRYCLVGVAMYQHIVPLIMRYAT